ncbi:Uncharacterised protein [Mycobacteroides abscessus subsp. abscessus]|nr:Uncharacterised protein [Mycobacteroides abscessus subsp. abscessus]
MAHSFIRCPGWITVNRKRKRPEMLQELFNERPFGRRHNFHVKLFIFNFCYALTQLREIFPADWSAKVADKNEHRILSADCFTQSDRILRTGDL